MTLVSIIVPVFNRGDIVHETIDSVRAQTFRDWELILVDDGSNDETIRILQHYETRDERIKVTVRPVESPKGANACRNYGFSLARGKYIQWIDSDDLLVPEALIQQVQILNTQKSIMAVLNQSVFFDSQTKERQEPWSRKVHSNDIIWDYVRNQIRWPIGGILWRRDFFSTPPFHEALKNSQEWLMHGLQLLRLTPDRFIIRAECTYLVRRGNSRMSSFRSADYYYNQALARALFLRSAIQNRASIKIRAELCKQVAIYFFHSLKTRLVGASTNNNV